MSAIPRRKPVPQGRGPESRQSSRVNTGSQAVPGIISAIATSQGGSSHAEDTDSMSHSSEEQVLVLNKAQVEELARLLLNLVGSASRREDAPQARTEESETSDSEASQSPVTHHSPRMRYKRPAVVVQEMLRPTEESIVQISQGLLHNKPWAHERIVVPRLGPDMDPDEHDVVADTDNLDDRDDDSFPLTPRRGLIGATSTSFLYEDSLYMIQDNHAWTDLRDRLGPGKFTDEGRQYLLSERRSGAWPNVIPPQKRGRYLVQLWMVMTAINPRSGQRYKIVSDFAMETTMSRTYKKAFASTLMRRSTPKITRGPNKARPGLLSKTTTRIRTISRALFSTADSARARLPSTLYLRMLGQNLFESCLADGEEDLGEKKMKILIAGLSGLTKAPDAQQRSALAPKVSATTATVEAVSDEEQPFNTVWELLVCCYRVGAMQQPPLGDTAGIWKDISSLFSVLQLANLFTARFDHSSLRSLPLEQVLSSSVQSIGSRFTIRKQESIYSEDKVEYFGKKDLSIKTMQDIGALNILWTRCMDDHLTLDTNYSEVRIFWPAWALANLPCSSLFSPTSTSEILRDLLVTYSFLFWSQDGLSAAIKDYNRLDPPSWLATMHTSLTELTSPRTLIGDIRYHFASYAHSNAEPQYGGFGNEHQNLIRFDTCGIFENRARILKGYMDSQKPSGLLALWRDKRDSTQWYTFWLVSIVGGISIFLGLASLAVSIAQTVAAFEALHYQTASTNVTSQSNATSIRGSTTSVAATATTLAGIAI